MTTWPQVPPYGAARAQFPAGLPGRGDEATWPACTGHPNDPRTDNIEAEAAEDEAIIEQADKLIERFDETDFRDAVLLHDDFDRLVAELQAQQPDPQRVTALLVRMRDEWAGRVAARICGVW